MSTFEEFAQLAPRKIHYPTVRETLEDLVRGSLNRLSAEVRMDGPVRFHVDVSRSPQAVDGWVVTVVLLKVARVPGGYLAVEQKLDDLLPFQQDMDAAVGPALNRLARLHREQVALWEDQQG